MKALPTFLIFSAMLVSFAGCGKKNESGKSNSGICLQYSVNGQCSSYSSNSYTSGNNVNLSGILSQIPCESSNGYGNMSRSQQTIRVQTSTIAKAGQSYLGVTSMGDIAVIVGNGTTNAQMAIYICGGQAPIAQQVGPILLGEYTTPSCPITTISAAPVAVGGYPFNFRSPIFGRGMQGVPFSFCR